MLKMYKDTDVAFFKNHLKTNGGIEIFIKHLLSEGCGLQNVHTPFTLCNDMMAKLNEYICLDMIEPCNKEIAVLFNLEFLHVLIKNYNIPSKNITIFVDDKREFEFCKLVYGMVPSVNLFFIDMDKTMKEKCLYTTEGESMKKFFVVVMNPPYQAKSEASKTKTQPIWDKFVNKAFSLCEEGGYISAVHPSGWRSCKNNIFTDAKILKEKQIDYLEIHNENDGLKTFGATTRYDWYVVQNNEISHETVVCDQNGIKTNIDLRKVSFIPNSMIEKVFGFMAKDGEEKVEVEYSRGAYGSDKKNVSKIQVDDFSFAVIYSTPINSPTIWYTNTKENGHFGISKIILNPCRPIGFVVDEKGEYGMSQFCVGIVGNKEYLDIVANVLKNQKTNGFADFMESCHFTDKIFNKDIISLFRKDFWKEFV